MKRSMASCRFPHAVFGGSVALSSDSGGPDYQELLTEAFQSIGRPIKGFAVSFIIV